MAAVCVEGCEVAADGGLGVERPQGGVERAQGVEQLLGPGRPAHALEGVSGTLFAGNGAGEGAERLQRRPGPVSELLADGEEAVGVGRLAQGRQRRVEPLVQGPQRRLQLPHGAAVETPEGPAERFDGLDGRRHERACGLAEGGGFVAGGSGHGEGV